jgi:D-alanyl-D-alanine carboxypeptidase
MEPTGLSAGNVSTPREVIVMLKQVIAHPVLGPITRRSEYEAHPVGKPPIRYVNTDGRAARTNVQLIGGKTGYNDFARYCLVVATKIDGHAYYMAFLGDEGKLTRFGDVARVADWIVSHKPKTVLAAGGASAGAPAPAASPVAPASPTPPASTAAPAFTAVPAAAPGPALAPPAPAEVKPPQPPIPIGVAAGPTSAAPAPSATP